VIDVDSFVGQDYGRLKEAPAPATRALGYHPLLAPRADPGEVLHIRVRTAKANTQRGVIGFVDELVARSAPPAQPTRSCSEPTRPFQGATHPARAKGMQYSIRACVTTGWQP
jgi:hypothetical protein